MRKLLDVRNLSISFRTDEGLITPVQNIDFTVAAGRTLGLVGESGSGKSVSTKSVMRLLPGNAMIDPAAQITYYDPGGEAVDIMALGKRSKQLRQLRGGGIGMIFQEPMASFSPVYTIGNQMMETIRLHRRVSKREAKALAIQMLDRVGISNAPGRIDQYPHELSGGMRQRAMIALALSAEPALLIADEPTTALDVTIQAQVLDLMRELQQEMSMGMIFITHDLGVIAQIADDVAVMYLGTIVEQGSTTEIIRNPKHPYTKGLLKAIPRLDQLTERMQPVPGDIPSPNERPTGCPFHTRCGDKIEGLCDAKPPPHIHLSDAHDVRCWLHDSKLNQELIGHQQAPLSDSDGNNDRNGDEMNPPVSAATSAPDQPPSSEQSTDLPIKPDAVDQVKEAHHVN